MERLFVFAALSGVYVAEDGLERKIPYGVLVADDEEDARDKALKCVIKEYPSNSWKLDDLEVKDATPAALQWIGFDSGDIVNLDWLEEELEVVRDKWAVRRLKEE